MNLFEIEQEYREAIEALYESEGEITPEIEATLAISKDMFEQKATAYLLFILEKKREIAQLDDVLFSLNQKKLAREKTIDDLKARVLSAMQTFEIPKFERLEGKCFIGFSESLIVTNQDAVPPKYVKIKTVTTEDVDKNALKAAIKSGLECEGAHIARKPNLQVK